MKLKIIAGLVVLALFAVGLGQLANVKDALRNIGASSGPDHYNLEQFFSGLNIGLRGTNITGSRCATASYDFPSTASTSVRVIGISTTTLALQGVTRGDSILASFDSATTTHLWDVVAKVTASAASDTAYGSTTVTFINWGVAALDLSTSTLEVCYVKQ